MSNSANKKLIISALTILLFAGITPIQAESLFRAGITHTTTPVTPRSWFSSIRARCIGDLVTILVEDSTEIENSVQLGSNKKSDTTDSWSKILDKVLPGKGVVPDLDGWGGASKVTNNASLTRSNTIKQTITTQVVQVLPNGNLVVQGRKRIINSGERQDVVISGIVNPRLINGEGQVKSDSVANLQIAIVGKGTVSRAQSDGVMNKLLRVFF